MDFQKRKTLLSLLFNNSRSFSHVNCYGESSAGRSLSISNIIAKNDYGWHYAFADLLYADGSMKLLLKSLSNEIGVKCKGENVMEFWYAVREDYHWPSTSTKKMIIFLDNAQAVVNFPTYAISYFLKSCKDVCGLQIRFVTSAPAPWICYQANSPIGSLPVREFHFRPPCAEACINLIREFEPDISEKFVRYCIDVSFIHSRAPNTLLRIVRNAFASYEESGKGAGVLDFHRMGSCLTSSSHELIGVETKFQSNEDDLISEAFESMPIAMRFLLVASFCASNNASSSDKRFFVKHHGKEKRSEAREMKNDLARQLKAFEPKPANCQRVFFIYKTFCSQFAENDFDKIDLKCVLASVASMGLVTISGPLEAPRVRCLISAECASKIAGSLKIQLRDYLEYTV
ncbi:unnamed protein product [Caenorhabditis auriculariae]|uniref:Origin recognition complex subunit 5 C-terminal domain-containing protein n=1 Tax=Caenorhabditis auriculariae TaxID=2777116 RepID=A0A8S1H9W2_9PELO|nr:unnamed protein product [Caenorhabditis auriculariae]